jgi:hypothetical protein
VAGDKLVVHGRHEMRDDSKGMEIAREVHRSYQLPSDVDPTTLKSNLDNRGILTISAAKKKCTTFIPSLVLSNAFGVQHNLFLLDIACEFGHFLITADFVYLFYGPFYLLVLICPHFPAIIYFYCIIFRLSLDNY